MAMRFSRTAEHVGPGHPDKFCDQVGDAVLDRVLSLASDQHRHTVRTAVECLAKDLLIVVSGEVNIPPGLRGVLDVEQVARDVFETIGYGDPRTLTVINQLRPQSVDIARGAGDGNGTDDGGAGDQGVMVGYATDETKEFMPCEWVAARDLCRRLQEARQNGLAWLGTDCKTQVTLDSEGRPVRVVVAAQHRDEVSTEEVRSNIQDLVIRPVLGEVPKESIHINGTGRFVLGGPAADAGVLGRKIVVDAYGPRVPVGGGAYSGKDPSKVDRSGAYMARHIAKVLVADKVAEARECTVTLAYCIGQRQPEMVTAVTDRGLDISSEVHRLFPDLSPPFITEYLGLVRPKGWCYRETATYGHYGRSVFPWEATLKRT